MLGAQISSRLYPWIGPRRMLTAGALGVAVTTSLMTTIGPGTSLWWLRTLMFLLGLCWSQAMVPLQAAAFATITPAATGAASTFSTPDASSAWRSAWPS
jgi:MFS family permease